MGFADCKETAIRVSGEIPNSEIYYGLYIATEPKEKWDSRWGSTSDPVFTHFWVVKDDTIIDDAADQFGANGRVITKESDPHYVVVGKYRKETNELIPTVRDPEIVWNTLTGNGGSVVVRWNNFDRYMKELKGREEVYT